MFRTLLVEGQGVPKATSRERLFPLIKDMAWRIHRVKIDPIDVNSVSRLNQSKRSPIVVKYGLNFSKSL